MKYNRQQIFASRNGWNEGIHCWRIHVVNVGFNMGIGIASVINVNNIGGHNWNNMLDVRYWYWQGGTLLSYISHSNHSQKEFPANMNVENNTAKYGDGDIVTVVLDCSHWYVSIYINGSPVIKHPIKRNRMYYPVIGTQHKLECRVLRE